MTTLALYCKSYSTDLRRVANLGVVDSGLDVLFPCDRGYESIALAGQRLDELRMVGGVTQRFAQVIHRLVESAIEVHERVRRPQTARQLFACDELARVFEQRKQQLQRLVAERRAKPMDVIAAVRTDI